MPDPETITRIQSVVQQVLDDPALRLDPESAADSIDGWDSLSHIQIVVALESEFGIRFSAAELIDFQNIGALADGIERKLAQADA
mgnify:CR=1 FL=1